MEPNGSLPYSQQSATDPYPELDACSPYCYILAHKVKLSLQQAVETHRIVEMSRLPHFLDSRLTDGSKVVSPTLRLPFTP
jgi:hypothetical protein